MIFPYRISSRQKRDQTISRPTGTIFKTGVSTLNGQLNINELSGELVGPNWASHKKNKAKQKLILKKLRLGPLITLSPARTKTVNSDSGMTESLPDGVKESFAMQALQNKWD